MLPVLPVDVVEDVPVVGAVDVDDVDAGMLPVDVDVDPFEAVEPVSVVIGTTVPEVSPAVTEVVADSVVELVSLVAVSLLLQANSRTAASAVALIHFIHPSYHSHELPFIRATIFATSM